jgi:hypothetical protein
MSLITSKSDGFDFCQQPKRNNTRTTKFYEYEWFYIRVLTSCYYPPIRCDRIVTAIQKTLC